MCYYAFWRIYVWRHHSESHIYFSRDKHFLLKDNFFYFFFLHLCWLWMCFGILVFVWRGVWEKPFDITFVCLCIQKGRSLLQIIWLYGKGCDEGKYYSLTRKYSKAKNQPNTIAFCLPMFFNIQIQPDNEHKIHTPETR